MKKLLVALAATLGIFLGSFALSEAATSYFITQQGGTGTTSPSGILYGDNGGTNHLNTVTVGSGLTFSGGTLSAAGGSGTVTQINTTWPILGGPITTTGTLTFGGLSTSTPAVISNIPYFSGVNTFANVATTTHSFSGPFTISGTLGALVGGANSTVTWSGLATTSQPASSNLLVSNGGAGVYGVATSTLSASSPLTGSFTQIGSGGALGCQAASGSQAGCLSSADWSTFNAKQAGGFQISTTSGIAISQLSYYTSTGTIIGGVATSSITLGAGLTNSSGTLGAQVGGSALTLKQIENRTTGATGTTTSGTGYAPITGTTTKYIEVGYGEVWNNVQCFTDVGTANVDFYYGTTHMFGIFNASTTISKMIPINATPTAGTKVGVDIGTPASSPTQVTCTVDDTN